MYAPTLRYHDNTFYVICEYLGASADYLGVIFKSTDPYDDASWSDPVIFRPTQIDPDLFWDDDGKVYMATAGITLQEIDLETGNLGTQTYIWNGTGGDSPEGPHIYKKDCWYYLMIAEGGTGPNHSITIARASDITGPYESYQNNPILTNRNTTEYYQSVGHGDLFQDLDGNWWGLCLALRVGPAFAIMPMGREAVLFNATWEDNEWPSLQPVRGLMPGDRLPVVHMQAPGAGPLITDSDKFQFDASTPMPPHFIHHRVPPANAFSITNNGLEITPSRANLSIPASASDVQLNGQRGLALVGRRQTDTMFEFWIDLVFNPQQKGQEAGVTVFRSQNQHINFGILQITNITAKADDSQLVFRLAAENPLFNTTSHILPVPEEWQTGTIRLEIQANNSSYAFTALSVECPNTRLNLGTMAANLVSGLGGIEFFIGSFVGVYATCNGEGSGDTCPEGGKVYISHWEYRGLGQQISADESVAQVGLQNS